MIEEVFFFLSDEQFSTGVDPRGSFSKIVKIFLVVLVLGVVVLLMFRFPIVMLLAGVLLIAFVIKWLEKLRGGIKWL